MFIIFTFFLSFYRLQYAAVLYTVLTNE